MRAIFIRHADSSGQEPEASLTARGVVQVRELAAALHGISIARVVSSPFCRSRQTAEPLAIRVTVELDDRLAEWQVPWVLDADWPRDLRQVLHGDTALPGDAEPRDAAIARGVGAFREVATNSTGVPVLVTHGKLLSLVLSTLGVGDPFELFMSFRNPIGLNWPVHREASYAGVSSVRRWAAEMERFYLA